MRLNLKNSRQDYNIYYGKKLPTELTNNELAATLSYKERDQSGRGKRDSDRQCLGSKMRITRLPVQSSIKA